MRRWGRRSPTWGICRPASTATVDVMITSALPRPLRVCTAIGSMASMVIGLVWLLFPQLNPYVDENLSLVRQVVALTPFTVGLTAVALVGTLVAAVAATRPHAAGAPQTAGGSQTVSGSEAADRGLRIAALPVTLGLLASLCSMNGLSMAGYTVALALPPVAVVVGIVAAVRVRRARLPLAIAAILVAVLLIVARTAWIGAFIAVIGSLEAKLSLMAGQFVLLVTAALWVACTVRLAARSATLRRLTPIVVRFRVPITVIAALGPVPYAAHRLTWLTPWPLFAPEASDSRVLAWGVALSAGAWMGAVLTLGLIRPWGERFPRWMPVVGGRVVPPAAAVIPGSVVAGLLCLAAVPWAALFGPGGVPSVYFWVLPVWLWGPALALAVWGYAGHRAGIGDPAGVGSLTVAADRAGWAR